MKGRPKKRTAIWALITGTIISNTYAEEIRVKTPHGSAYVTARYVAPQVNDSRATILGARHCDNAGQYRSIKHRDRIVRVSINLKGEKTAFPWVFSAKSAHVLNEGEWKLKGK